MKYEQVKGMVRSAIADWNHLYEHDWTPENADKKAYYLKLETCGDKRYRPDGTAYWKKCRSIVCCRCSRLWSRKQAQNLISCYPEVKTKEEFCSMTIMIGITRNIAEVFPIIRNARSRIKQLFRNKARSIKPNMFHWKQFGMAGTFEVDVFDEKDYYLLGSKKKAQLEQALGYKHIEDSNQNVWCVHIHSVCFMGMLSTAEIEKTLEKMNGISVHFQELDELKSRDVSIRTILRYGSKVCFSRRLANGKSLKWTDSQLKEYMNVIYKERGRSSMKCFISPVGIRSKKSVIKSILSNSVSTL